MPKRVSTLLRMLSLFILAALLLSACNFPLFSPTSDVSTDDLSSTESPSQPTDQNDAPAGSTNDNCLIGRWQVTDFSAYFDSIKSSLPADSDLTITNSVNSGTAIFEFDADGVTTFSGEQFNQSFTVSSTVSGLPLEIPVSILVDGPSKGHYSLTGDRISFHDVEYDNTTIDISVMGSSTRIEDTPLNTEGETDLYTYTCENDSLWLKLISVDLDLAPITLIRIR